MMGSRPYPYLLHRAHETALVKMEEKQQIEQMLAMELRRHDEEVDDGSYKQSAKGFAGQNKNDNSSLRGRTCSPPRSNPHD